jgi:hypothetical protein
MFRIGQAVAHPFSPLLLFSVAMAALMGAYFAAGLAPSIEFERVASFSWAILLVLWVVADARRRTATPCFDFGLFCYGTLPFVVPWYCFWSRGWRGVITLAAVIGICLMPYIVANAVWLAVYG